MDWDKAKNIMIIFLLILNVSLGALISMNSQSYTLSQEQESAIIKVLADNKIVMYADVLKKYDNMPQIELAPADYAPERFMKLFFAPGAEIEMLNEYDRVVYFDERDNTMYMMGDSIYFEGVLDGYAFEFSKAAAREACDRFMADNKDLFPDFAYETPNGFETKEGYQLTYRQHYKSTVLFKNYVTFTSSEKGIVKIAYSYKAPIGPERKTKEIIAPDEALFTLMRQLLNTYNNLELIINRMDMVYSQEDTLEENREIIKAEPCYRFWVEGIDKPFLINAATGEME